MLYLYKKKLEMLLTLPQPSSLQLLLIHTLLSDTDYISIYEMNPRYARISIPNHDSFIYFYSDLHCSLLTPPPYKRNFYDWCSHFSTKSSTTTLDIEFIKKIIDNTQEQIIISDEPLIEKNTVETIADDIILDDIMIDDIIIPYDMIVDEVVEKEVSEEKVINNPIIQEEKNKINTKNVKKTSSIFTYKKIDTKKHQTQKQIWK